MGISAVFTVDETRAWKSNYCRHASGMAVGKALVYFLAYIIMLFICLMWLAIAPTLAVFGLHYRSTIVKLQQSEAAQLQKKVKEYVRGYVREKARPYARGLAPRFSPRGVAPGKTFAMSAFAIASAPGFFPHKRPFCQGFCPFDRDFAPDKR
ncbi:transmembrane protein, putative [Medicago truncatula]|uniref:Transmembrane protein, putative n=1 Tax=Medicago truncatula TaxID=3880 RepID=G7JQ56_MEDTR|nr:transmembrane protein, putative [Medicago truncatula]